MRRDLYPGPIGPRAVFRWLLRQPRDYSDVHFRIESTGPFGPLTGDALFEVQMVCKELYGSWHRTRGWYARGHRRVKDPGQHGNRGTGRRHARVLAAFLRAAHTEGCDVVIRGAR